MTSSTAFRALLAIDGRTVGRDSLLRWIVVLPVMLALIVRFGLPALAQTLEARFGFDLVPYYPLALGLLVLLVPQFVGLVLGFLLLDQRDDGTLDALRVTPVSPRALVAYRFGVPVSLSALVTVVVYLAAGTLPYSAPAVVVATLGAAPYAVLNGLIIATVARNKIQGFAVAKGAGVLTVIPIISWFAAEPWQFCFGLAPTYWPIKAFWAMQAGDLRGVLFAAVGIVWMVLIIGWLLRRFEARLGAR